MSYRRPRGSWRDERDEPLTAEQLKIKVNVADVLRHYGGEIPSHGWSGWRRMRCPFHPDTTASASVNTEAGRFRCHGCDAAGDVIDLVQWREDLGFKEAVEWLASRF